MSNVRELKDLQRVLPSLVKSDAPEEELIKFARSRGMAAAQFERLVQVTNAAMVVAAASKKKDNTPLLPVQDMVERYKGSLGRGGQVVKSAARARERLHAMPRTGMVKVARAAQEPRAPAWEHYAPGARERVEAAERKAAGIEVRREVAELYKLASSFVTAADRALFSAAGRVSGDARAIVEALQDVRSHAENCGDARISGLLKSASVVLMRRTGAAGLEGELEKLAEYDDRAFLTDRHGVVEDMQKCAHSILYAARACREAARRGFPHSLSGFETDVWPVVKSAVVDEEEEEDEEKDKGGKDKKPRGGGFADPNAPPESREINPFTHTQAPAGKSEKTDKPADISMLALLGLPLRGLEKSTDIAQDAVRGAPASPEDFVSRVVAPLLDESSRGHEGEIAKRVAQTNQRAALMHLMHNDPLVSKADPRTVVSLAESIRQLNPSVAADPNLLGAALREALQYSAVPGHTQESLVKTRSETAKTRDAEARSKPSVGLRPAAPAR